MKYLSAWGSFYWVVPIVIASIMAVLFLENKRYKKPVLWLMLGMWSMALIYLLFIYRLRGSGVDTGFTFDFFHIFRKASGTDWEARQAQRQILFNILLYVPLGCVLISLTGRIWLSIVIGISISVITEALQGLTGLGWADVDDVLNNGLGLLIGLFVYKTIVFRSKNGE